MRQIKYIVLHTTASKLGTDHRNIIKYFIDQHNFRTPRPPYHFMIGQYGQVWECSPIDNITYGVANKNRNSIHIATIGGLISDDRTSFQNRELARLLLRLNKKFPDAQILGHRDFPNVRKSCPRYDAKAFWDQVLLINDIQKFKKNETN
tara:strand:- start:73 stop:519 length:447 start_codon:yes stop_codon:yes gene_type:complete